MNAAALIFGIVLGALLGSLLFAEWAMAAACLLAVAFVLIVVTEASQ